MAQIPVDGKQGPPDVCVIELGGTVGDIESAPFVEALRQFQFRVGARVRAHAHTRMHTCAHVRPPIYAHTHTCLLFLSRTYVHVLTGGRRQRVRHPRQPGARAGCGGRAEDQAHTAQRAGATPVCV